MNRSRERRVATAATVALLLAAGAGVLATSARGAEETPQILVGVLGVVPATGNLDTTPSFVTHGTCGPEDTVVDLAAVGTGISDDPEAGLVLVRDPVPVAELTPAPGGGGYSVPMYGSWRAVAEDQEFGLPLDGPVSVALFCLSPGQAEAAGTDRKAAIGATAAGDDVVQNFLAELDFTATAATEPTQATYGPAPAESPSTSPSPSASPTPSASPSPSPSAAPTPSPTPSPAASPTTVPSPSPSPEILASSPSPSPTPDASVVTTTQESPAPTPSPAATPPAPGQNQVGVTVQADTTLPASGGDGRTMPLVVLGLTFVAGGSLAVYAFRREDTDSPHGA